MMHKLLNVGPAMYGGVGMSATFVKYTIGGPTGCPSLVNFFC